MTIKIFQNKIMPKENIKQKYKNIYANEKNINKNKNISLYKKLHILSIYDKPTHVYIYYLHLFDNI